MIEQKFKEVERYLPKLEKSSEYDTSRQYEIKNEMSENKETIDDLLVHDFRQESSFPRNDIRLFMKAPQFLHGNVKEDFDLQFLVYGLKKYWELAKDVNVTFNRILTQDPFTTHYDLRTDDYHLHIVVDTDGIGTVSFQFNDSEYMRELVQGYVSLLRSQHTASDIATEQFDAALRANNAKKAREISGMNRVLAETFYTRVGEEIAKRKSSDTFVNELLKLHSALERAL